MTTEPSSATAEGGGDLHQTSPNYCNCSSENQSCPSPAEEDWLQASDLSRTGHWEQVLAEETEGAQNNQGWQRQKEKSCLSKPCEDPAEAQRGPDITMSMDRFVPHARLLGSITELNRAGESTTSGLTTNTSM